MNIVAPPPIQRVVVTGASGFVGRHVCEHLVRQGVAITAPTRKLSHARAIAHLPGLTAVQADVHDEQQLAALMQGHDAVIHLVAVLHGNASHFERTHVDLPAKVVRACKAAGVHRLLHVSAIGVSESAPSMYLRSKAKGEAVVRASGLDVSVLRPSVIFGADDKFTNLFARLQQFFPVLPLAGASAQFQPVWVQDVAAALVKLLMLPKSQRPAEVWEACGPEVLSLAQVVQRSGARVGCARPVLGLPEWVGMAQAAMMECLPGEPLMSRDNVRSMRVPNVASGKLPGLASLGIAPRAL